MKLTSCSREKELRDLIAAGQWPAACPPELHTHVAGCRSCGELVLVAEAFRSARAATIAAAKPVPPGVLWWRAQLRRRNAAVERLERPLIGAQIFTVAVALLAGVGFAAAAAARNGGWLAWLQQLPQDAALHWDNLRSNVLTDPTWSWTILAPAAATLLLLTGIAIYFATERQ
jgi:hypothetical protein